MRFKNYLSIMILLKKRKSKFQRQENQVTITNNSLSRQQNPPLMKKLHGFMRLQLRYQINKNTRYNTRRKNYFIHSIFESF